LAAEEHPEAASDPERSREGKAKSSRKRRRKRKQRFSVLRFILLFILVSGAVGGGMALYAYRELERDLPATLAALHDYQPSRATRVYDLHGELIGEFFLQRRVLVPFSRIPLHVQHAFVAGEDNRFYDHGGLDPIGIARAAYENYKAGALRQGGSTITQQVAKLMLLSGERKLIRKMREAGARAVYSFIDAGVASTVDAQDISPAVKGILAKLNEEPVDFLFIELGDGILGHYQVETLLTDRNMMSHVIATVVCASDLVAAYGAREILSQHQLPITLFSGPCTDNQAGITYIEGQFSLPAANVKKEPDKMFDVLYPEVIKCLKPA
jgi:hypothetical protein